MITALILMIIFSLLMLIFGSGSLYIAYRAMRGYFEITEQNDEYLRFMEFILDEIDQSSEMFRTELARRISINLTEYKELNSYLHALETRMQTAKMALKEFLTEE